MARAEQFDQRDPAFVRDAACGWCELLIQARDEGPNRLKSLLTNIQAT